MSIFRDMVSNVLSKINESRPENEGESSSSDDVNSIDNTAEDSSDHDDSDDDDDSTEYPYSSEEESKDLDSDDDKDESESDEEDDDKEGPESDEEEQEEHDEKEESESDEGYNHFFENKRNASEESLVESDEDSNEDEDQTSSSSKKLAIEVIDRSTSKDDSVNSKVDNMSSPDEFVTDLVSLGTPTVVHIFDDRQFYHLHKFEPELNIIDDFVETITFALYIYVICNNTYHDPYMTCMMQYNSSGKYYTFPYITYENSTTLDKETHIKSIKNKCFEMIFPLFNVDPSNIDESFFEFMDRSFKGFFYESGNKRGIIGINVEPFIPFLNQKSDATTLSQYFHSTSEWNDDCPQYAWAGLDELLGKKKIYHIPINPRAIQTLSLHPWIYEIVDEEYRKSRIPKILFSEEKSPQRSFDNQDGHMYFFHETVPKEQFQQPRYVVFPSAQAEVDRQNVYGVFTVTNFKEF